MGKFWKAVVIGSVAFVLAIVPFGAAFGYPDVISGLTARGYDHAPELWFSWSAAFHQDTFPTSGLLESGGGPAYSAGPGGYITVGRVLAHPNTQNPNAADRVVMYGAGNVFEVDVANGGEQVSLPVASRLKVAIGNLAAARVELVSAGDTEVQGTANALDSLTGAALQIPAARFTDTNNDGIIMYRTTFNAAVAPGADKYYDYNRDGQIVDAALSRNVANRAASDRPFVAIYETKTGGPIDLAISPTFNADGDASGSLTDNLWLGNPYARVNADAGGGPRGTDGESPPGTPESDPNIVNIDGFATPLLIGEIRSLSMLTVVNLSPQGASNAFFVSSGEFDAEITDGRLYDWYESLHDGLPLPCYNGVVNASLLFGLASRPLTEYEYRDDGTLVSEGEAVCEPAIPGVLLWPVFRLALRRRK